MGNISKIRIQNTDYAIKDSRLPDGTSSQFVKGDGSLDSTSYVSSTDAIKNADYLVSSYVTLTNYIKGRVFDRNSQDTFFAANSRFVVTHKRYSSTDDSFINNLSTDLFKGSFNSYGNTVLDGEYGILYIGKVAEDELSSTSSTDSCVFVYPQGKIFLTFYTSMRCGEILEAKGWFRNDTTWRNLTVVANNTLVYEIQVPNVSYLKAIRIKYSGSNLGGEKKTSLSDVAYIRNRDDITARNLITKYPTAQQMYGNLTAPKFITSGGTSSQFVKGDGSLDSNTYAGAQISGGAANKAVSIPFGQVDSTSTSTAFTATVDGITELRDGVCVYLKNGVVTSAANCTLNVNGLGAKPMYNTMASTTAISTQWNVNYTMLFIYNSTRVSGGCWDMYYGYDSDLNTIGYQLRTNSYVLPVSDTSRYYKIFFTSADNTKWVPASVDSTNNATSARPVNQRPINPFGSIVYLHSTANFTTGTNVTATAIWQQYLLTLGYSFNRTGAALTLTTSKPVFIKCAPQNDGSAIIDANTPYVQDLPTTEDGKIYIFLGVAYSATQVELQMVHPVYYYKNGSINPWTGTGTQTDVSKSTESNVIDVGGYDLMKINEVKGKSLVMNQIMESFSNNWLTNSCTKTLTDGVFKIVPSAARCYVYGVSIIQVFSSHKYYCSCHIKANSSITRNFYFSFFQRDFGGFSNLEISSNWNKITLVANAPIDTSNGKACLVFSNCETTDEIYVKNYIVVDLTQMFGAGNEPTTVEEVEAILGNEYYEYNTGEVVGNNVEKLDVTGFNMLRLTGRTEYATAKYPTSKWDFLSEDVVIKGMAYNGYLYPNNVNSYSISKESVTVKTGTDTGAAPYGLGFPVKVLPNTSYNIKCNKTSGTSVSLSWFNSDGYFISGLDSATNNIKTSPANARWCVLIFKPYAVDTEATFDNPIINKSNASKNGTYEPYKHSEFNLNLTELTGKDSNYTELEYIESTGTQYIDTGIFFTANDKMEFKICPLVNSGDTAFYGSYQNGAIKELGTLDGMFRFDVNTNQVSISTTQSYIISFNNGWYVDEQFIANGINNTNTSHSLILFGRYYNNNVDKKGSSRFYYYKHERNGQLILNLIPAKRNSDNAIGMYDTVSGTFFANAGTGTFIAGAEIPLNNSTLSVTICPDGLHGVGTVYDSLIVDDDGYARRAVKRMGSVDLGTLSWNVPISANPNCFYCNSSSWTSLVASRYNSICNVYPSYKYGTSSSAINNAPDNTLFINKGSDGTTGNFAIGSLIVKDSSKASLTAAAFKTAMSGVMLYYELATPIEYVLDTPLQCVAKVYPNGTVKQVPVMPDSTPMVMDVTYLRDNSLYAIKEYVNDAIADKADAATTLAGYGITDAKIENGVITLGSNSVTPLKKLSGTTAERPTDVSVGDCYFDTDLGKDIYVKEVNNNVVTWVDSNGFSAVPTIGTTDNRPNLFEDYDRGFEYFDTNLKTQVYLDYSHEEVVNHTYIYSQTKSAYYSNPFLEGDKLYVHTIKNTSGTNTLTLAFCKTNDGTFEDAIYLDASVVISNTVADTPIVSAPDPIVYPYIYNAYTQNSNHTIKWIRRNIHWIPSQSTDNLVTSVSSSSTDAQYPSAKCVYDLIGDIETLLASI